MSTVKNALRLCLCAGGIYVSYISYGLIQEYIYKGYVGPNGEKFTFTLTQLLLQVVVSMSLGLVSFLFTEQTPGVPVTEFVVPSTTYILAMLFSNEALKHVNYPTQVIGKSCKLVPVLLANVFLFGKRESWVKWAQVVLVTSGVAMFSFNSSKDSGRESSTYGLLLLVGSLVMDGVTGPNQKRVSKKYHPTEQQFIVYSNFWATIILLVLLFAVGEGTEGIKFLLQPEHNELLRYVAFFCVCGAVGQNFIFLTMRWFGPLALTTVTTTRKFFTVLGSIFYYKHAMEERQWVAVVLVFTGLALDIVRGFLIANEERRDVEKKDK